MLLSRAIVNIIPTSCLYRRLYTNPICLVTYHEDDEKFGYGKYDPKRKLPLKEKIENYQTGFKELKKEIKMWKEEVKDKMLLDPHWSIYPNELDIVWEFNETTLDEWVVTSDSDHAEGHSEASLTVSTLGNGMFSGILCSDIPNDGKLKRSGYCNLKSKRVRKSFKRETTYEWPMYTHLVIRCRGDGRSYMLNLHTPGSFDITWGDMYSYTLYTRGGPYWQITKIPFSKFFFQSKGRIQDLQDPLPVDRVTSIGLTMADQNNGPFQLELDYIGLEYDPTHHEQFAYEMYLLENEVRGIVHW